MHEGQTCVSETSENALLQVPWEQMQLIKPCRALPAKEKRETGSRLWNLPAGCTRLQVLQNGASHTVSSTKGKRNFQDTRDARAGRGGSSL